MTADHPNDQSRRPISKRLRYEVMRRDNFACRYCGAKAPDADLTIDHVQPVALGGSDEPENLVTACTACNAGKSSSAPDAPIVAGVSDDALRWAEAMKEAAKTQSASRKRLDRQVKKFDKKWCEFVNPYDEPIKRQGDWRASIRNFLAAGLTVDDLCELVDETMAKPNVKGCWKYFCGCCWNLLRERQAIAASLLEVEEGEDE